MRKPVLQSKQQGRYQIFTANQTARWYEEITRGNIASPATNMTKLVTTEAFINYSREVLSQITQLQIDKRNISEYLQKRKISKRLLQLQRDRNYTWKVLPGNIIEERGDLRVSRPEITLAVKHAEEVQRNEVLAMKIYTAKRAIKALHNTRKLRATDSKVQTPTQPTIATSRAHNGVNLDGRTLTQHMLVRKRPSSCHLRIKEQTSSEDFRLQG